MRSLALTALLGSCIVSTSLIGQSLTEHAAAAAGATIGTAAGKPLGTALGKVFGEVDKNASTAATPKTAKPVVVVKPAAVAPSETTAHASGPVAGSSGGVGDVGGGSGGGGGSSHHSAHRKTAPVPLEPEAARPVPVVAPVEALVIVPVVKEPSAQDVAGIQVGATFSELRQALGAPESTVSIPGDDGHLLEICQYWAKGEPVGTIRLDNGRVVSVQANN
jgi:hypothetical protein